MYPGRESCAETLWFSCIPRAGSLTDRHEHPPARVRRPRTRAGVEDRGFPAGDKTVVRARQCRDRAGSRMRRARHCRSCRGDRFLPGQRGRFCRGRSGNADRRRDRRRSHRGRLQGVRSDQGGRPAGELQEVHQGAVPAPTTFRPRPISISAMPMRRKPISARRARRSSSRPTVLRPARASWSR